MDGKTFRSLTSGRRGGLEKSTSGFDGLADWQYLRVRIEDY